MEQKTLFQRILDDIKWHMDAKSFTEEKLKSFDPPGTLLKKIRKGFVEAIVADPLKFEVKKVQVQTTGYFTEKKHKVDFVFVFCYDGRKPQFDLRLFGARWDDVKIYVNIDGNALRNLPPAKKAFETLVRLKKQHVLRDTKPAIGLPSPPNKRKKAAKL